MAVTCSEWCCDCQRGVLALVPWQKFESAGMCMARVRRVALVDSAPALHLVPCGWCVAGYLRCFCLGSVWRLVLLLMCGVCPRVAPAWSACVDGCKLGVRKWMVSVPMTCPSIQALAQAPVRAWWLVSVFLWLPFLHSVGNKSDDCELQHLYFATSCANGEQID